MSFGIHARRISQTDSSGIRTPLYPEIGYGIFRLTEPLTCKWRAIEAEEGVFDWSNMDYMVDFITDAGLIPYYVFGGAPDWAVASNPGAGQVPTVSSYQAFTEAVVERYAGRGFWYELWNEMDYSVFFAGTEEQASELIDGRATALKAIDETATIIAPSMTAAGAFWYDRFLRTGAADGCDGIAYHSYVYPSPPEKIVGNARIFNGLKEKYGFDLLINSEFTWHSFVEDGEVESYPALMSQEKGAAYLIWTLVLNHLSGADCSMFFGLDEDIETNAAFSCIQMLHPTTKAKLDVAVALEHFINLMVGGTISNYRSGFPIDRVSISTGDGRTGEIIKAAEGTTGTMDLSGYASGVDVLGEEITLSSTYTVTDSPIFVFN